jgi:hypothetical protein
MGYDYRNANSRQKELQERFSYADARERDEAFRKMLGTPEGRVVMRWVAAASGYYAKTGWGEGLEYRSGRRDFGAEFLGKCNEVAPEMVALSLKERNEQNAKRKELLKEAADG